MTTRRDFLKAAGTGLLLPLLPACTIRGPEAADAPEADWGSVRVRQADNTPAYGDRMTGGSVSIHTMWDPAECRAESGGVVHSATRRRLAYGRLARAASALPVPARPSLKDPSEFRLIGTTLGRWTGTGLEDPLDGVPARPRPRAGR